MGKTLKQFAADFMSAPPESVMKRNPHLFRTPKCVKEHPAPIIEDCPPAKISIQTTDEAKLNKTERAYLAYVRCLGFAWIGVQNVTLKLADDCRYTPDFWCVNEGGFVQAREVKGFFRDDAKVKIKVAARMFPWIQFQIVRKTKTGWDHAIVKP